MRIRSCLPLEKLGKYFFWRDYLDGKMDIEEFQTFITKFSSDLKNIGFNNNEIETLKRVPPRLQFLDGLTLSHILQFLQQLDAALLKLHYRNVEIVLVGGTVIEFISTHKRTKDIDFSIVVPSLFKKDWYRFPVRYFLKNYYTNWLIKILRLVPLSYVIDVDFFLNCDLPSLQLVKFEKYMLSCDEISKKSNVRISPKSLEFKAISLKFLSPLDIIASKFYCSSYYPRRKEKDLPDIELLLQAFPEITAFSIFRRLEEIFPNFYKRFPRVAESVQRFFDSYGRK
jgi:hypothetical protein